MTAAVQVRGLCKTYGRVPAVSDLDLDVEHGEVFAILGPNGAGKTTTIEILEGNRSRDAGQVLVLGEDPATAGRAWRARIGIVLQEVSDAGMLTVRETVQMFTNCYGSARDCAEVLELVGLAEVSDRAVRTLSGGQRRRLDVALGIVGLPENLGDAVEELAQSDLAKRALGEHIFERYVDIKRAEWHEYRIQVHPWEIERYLDVL